MKKILLLLLFFCGTCVGSEKGIGEIAISMCYGSSDPTAGFVMTQALLGRYENDSESLLALKESMALCVVREGYIREAANNADEVIKLSSDPFYIGCAWFQKGRLAIAESRFLDAITYAEIAIKCLEDGQDDEGIGSLQWRKAFQFLSHKAKNTAYSALKDNPSAEKEVVIIKTLEDELRVLGEKKKLSS